MVRPTYEGDTLVAHYIPFSKRVSLVLENTQPLGYGPRIAQVLYFFLMLPPNPHSVDLEWQLVDIANASYQKVSVSLYDTFGDDSVGEWDNGHSKCKYSNLTSPFRICVRSFYNQAPT